MAGCGSLPTGHWGCGQRGLVSLSPAPIPSRGYGRRIGEPQKEPNRPYSCLLPLPPRSPTTCPSGLGYEGFPGYQALGLGRNSTLWALPGDLFPPAPSGPGRGEAWDPGLTIKVVQGHDDVQVSTQDLAKLVHQGRVNSRTTATWSPDSYLGVMRGSGGGWRAAHVGTGGLDESFGRGVAAAGT